MALRIEYILTLAITITSAVILYSKPQRGIEIVESNSTKEFYFKNFTLLELNSSGVKNSLKAREATKYIGSFFLKQIELNYKNEDKILADRAIYIKDNIFLKGNIVFEEINRFKFWSSNLSYNIKSKEIYTNSRFKLYMAENIIVGNRLQYNMVEKEILASNIDANLTY